MMKKLSALVLIFALVGGFVVHTQTIELTDDTGADATLFNDADKGPEISQGNVDNDYIEVRNHSVRTRIGYIKFDLSSVDGTAEDAKIGLMAQKSGGLPQPMMTFEIYGMTDDGLDQWVESEISYSTAPGFVSAPPGQYQMNDKMEELTFMKVYKDTNEAYLYSEPSAAMDDYINNDGNGIVTFAILQDTTNPGDNYLFDSKETPEGGAPKLILSEGTAVENPANAPESFNLAQNYPNPFNPVTNIEFTLKEAGFTELKVYNMVGELVKTVVSKDMNQGSYKIKFNAQDLTSGIYYYKLESGDFSQARKMILIK